MALQSDGDGGLLTRLGHIPPPNWQFLAYRPQFSVKEFSTPAPITGTITQPWRIATIAADLNALVNCDIVHNVSEPPDPKLFPQGIKTDWVKPGRARWMYMDGVGMAPPEGNRPARGESYTATTIRDGEDASSVPVDHVSVRSNESISLDLRSGGGFVARYEK